MSQFNDPTMGDPPPPKKSNTMLIVLIIVGVLVVLPLLCCGLGSFFMYRGVNMAMTEGGRQLVSQVENTPEMQEHIGTVTKAEMSLTGTAQRAQRTGQDGVLVINVEGTKGSGVVLIENMHGETFESATLELPDGRAFPLK